MHWCLGGKNKPTYQKLSHEKSFCLQNFVKHKQNSSVSAIAKFKCKIQIASVLQYSNTF